MIVSAAGHHLRDIDGNRILDAMAGLWCVNVGYGREELIEAATQQMRTLPYYNSFFKTSNLPAAELAEKLSELAPPGLDHVIFASSGSEANDSAVRLARHFWALEGKPAKRVIISRDFAYHGSTVVCASMGGLEAMHKQAARETGFARIRPPYSFLHGKGMSEEKFASIAAQWLEDCILAVGANRVAAFFAEPVQGAGGLIIPPRGYFERISRICERHDVLLIADEVITGFGRTGDWFASPGFRLRPDMMSLAKGLTSGYLPMSALMVGDRVARALIDKGGEFSHGFTYSSHPVAAAVALANIELIKKDGLLGRIAETTASHFRNALMSLADHPLVGEARSCGLLGALELVRDKAGPVLFPPEKQVGPTCRDNAIRRGLMVRAVRDTIIMAPPLTFTTADIDEMASILKLALDDTLTQLGRAAADRWNLMPRQKSVPGKELAA